MKKFAFVLLGLLAALASFVTATWGVKGSWFGLLLAAAFAYGAFGAFRKVGRLASVPKPARNVPVSPVERRPWEH